MNLRNVHVTQARDRRTSKRRLAFPPALILVTQHDEALFAVVRVLPYEFQPDLFYRQRRRSGVYIEHR
jgi:hypothetical protein